MTVLQSSFHYGRVGLSGLDWARLLKVLLTGCYQAERLRSDRDRFQGRDGKTESMAEERMKKRERIREEGNWHGWERREKVGKGQKSANSAVILMLHRRTETG